MNTQSAFRKKAWIVLGLVALCAVLATPAWSAAQDAKGKAAANAAPPAADDDVKKDASAPAAATPAKSTESESTLHWVIHCSGFIGLVILLLSVYFVSTVGRLFWEMRMEVAAPPELVLKCESMLEQRDFKGIYALTKEDDSFFSRLLTTGIGELPNGLSEARDAMERLGDAITAEMEKKISMLAVLGTLGPMIGLLGTLKGMIGAFSVIAMSGQQLEAGKVAQAISESLLLTFEGVGLSVPAIFFFALFRNRVIYIASSVGLTADQFLRHFSHAGRAKASTAAPVAKTPS
ncbi:MAG: MotA/TolQ/ExbB proton channel family protein [Thermoguttaceae bacterium]